MTDLVTTTPVTCRKCGRVANDPVYSTEHYGGQPALFWYCVSPNCAYSWTLLIYATPETEIRVMRHRLKETECAAQQVTDLVDLIHAHGSGELIAMADELVGGEGRNEL